MRLAIRRGDPYDHDAWVRRTAAKLGLESTLRPVGRPKVTKEAESMASDPVPSLAARYLRVVLNLMVVAFCALMLDGCLNRDPYVQLPNGYAIAAISCGSPCHLRYENWRDRRSYSDWIALHHETLDSSGRQSEDYLLVNRTNYDVLKFPSELEWKAAIREKHAVPGELDTDACSGITRFGQRGPFIFGDCDKGYFLLNIDRNELQLFGSQDEWTGQIAVKTGAPPGNMKNPKSWLLQSRDAVEYGIAGGFVLITLPWVFAPMWRSFRKK